MLCYGSHLGFPEQQIKNKTDILLRTSQGRFYPNGSVVPQNNNLLLLKVHIFNIIRHFYLVFSGFKLFFKFCLLKKKSMIDSQFTTSGIYKNVVDTCSNI